MSTENDLFDLDNNSENSSINEDDKTILFGFEKIINSEKVHSVIPENQSIRSRKSVSQSSKKSNRSNRSFFEDPPVVRNENLDDNNFHNANYEPEQNFGSEPERNSNGDDMKSQKSSKPFDMKSTKSDKSLKKSSRGSSEKPKSIEKKKIELLAEYEYEAKKHKNRSTLPVLSKHSSIEDIQYELDRIKLQRTRQNSIDFYQSCTVSLAKGIEIFFDKLDIFDIDMNGFSVSIKHSSEKFEDIYAELYEKYKGTGKTLPPEIRFIGVFLTCAVGFVMTNQAPKMFANLINNKQPVGAYREMSPPSTDDEPFLDEMLMDIREGKKQD